MNALIFRAVAVCGFLIRCRNILLDCFMGMGMDHAEYTIDDTEDSVGNVADGVRLLGSLWLSAAMMMDGKEEGDLEDLQELQKFAADHLTQYILHTVGQEGLEVTCNYTEEGLLEIKERVETFNRSSDQASIVFDTDAGIPVFLKLHRALSELAACNINDSADVDFGNDTKTPCRIMYALSKRAASCNSAELRQITRVLSFLVGSSSVCEETFLIICDAAHVWANRVNSASVEEKNAMAACLDVLHDNLQIMSDKMRVLGELGLIDKIKHLLSPRSETSFHTSYDFAISALDGNKDAIRPMPDEFGYRQAFLKALKP